MGQIHRGGPSGNLHFAAGREALDAIAANHDHLIVEHLSGANIQQLTGVNVGCG